MTQPVASEPAPQASFAIKGNLIYFTSDRGGAYATMFGPGGVKLSYREDASVFNHDAFRFTWAFEYLGQHGDGKRFVFATADRSAVGVEHGYGIELADLDFEVIRDDDGKPIRLQINAPPVTELAPLKSLVFAMDAITRSRPRASLSGEPPRVSIITCSYNRPGMLIECIASVRAQTDESWEHLICDDGSTDDAVKEVLERAAALDPRVRVWRKGPNVNQPARYWNELLDRARGVYFAFLDDDNLKHPEFVATLSAVLDSSPEVDMVTCGCKIVDKSQGISESLLNLKTSPAEIERRSTIDTGCFLIRREAMERIGYFPLNIRTNEDWAMMRRAVECLNMVHLPDVLATYRSHDGQRMEYCDKLGNERDKKTVQGAVWGLTYGVRIYHPPFEKLTMSQRDVVEGVQAGVTAIPWVEEGSDLAIVLMPFRMDIGEIELIAASHRSVLSFHSEDPFALNANLERVRAMTAVCDDVWVSSNDTTCVNEYRSLIGDRLIVCSSLSIDDRIDLDDVPMSERFDAILVGYAYPGRIAFMKEFLRHFKPTGRAVRFVGDGWEQAGFRAAPTKVFLNTASVYAQAKAVICLHRGHGDCFDGPYEPRLVQRGYVEGMGGARVFIDDSRSDHALDDGEVEWFSSPHDLFVKLDRFLKLPAVKQEKFAAPLRERCWRDFTYRTRMARVINAVRSPRYGAMIP